jgi:hypothetical protein
MYKVYVQTDARGNVVEVTSDHYLGSADGYILVDEGDGERYREAATQYLAKDLRGFNGAVYTPNYKLVDGAVIERTETEKALDPYSDAPEDAITGPETGATDVSGIKGQLDALRGQVAVLEAVQDAMLGVEEAGDNA